MRNGGMLDISLRYRSEKKKKPRVTVFGQQLE